MAGGRRRIITRSVSATQPQLVSSSTPAPPPLTPQVEEPQEDLTHEPGQDQHQHQSHDAPRLLALPPAFKKRQSSINLDDLKEEEVGSSGHKRVKGEPSDTSAEEQEERRLEGGGETARQMDNQPGPSTSREPSPLPVPSIQPPEEDMEALAERERSEESSGAPNALKRARDAEMDVGEDEPRKRRAVSDEDSETPRQEQKQEQEQAAVPPPSSASSLIAKPLSLFNPKTPFLDLRSMTTPKLRVPKTRSLPKMPSQFTPVLSNMVKRVSSPGKQMKRLSLDDSGYYDLVVPLKGEDEQTPRIRRGSPGLPNAKFTFNPFAVGALKAKEQEQEEGEDESRNEEADAKERRKSEPPPETIGGDKFGPAIPSLDHLLESSEEPTRLTDSVIRRGPQEDENGGMSPPPSPSKQVLPANVNAANAKVRPSMIPRLVLAPPPPPNPKKPAPAAASTSAKATSPQKKPINKTLTSISPSKSFARFFASPAKGSTGAGPSRPPPRPATAMGRSMTTSFLSRKAGVTTKAAAPAKDGDELKKSTNLSEEAQASLAKMSQALEKLAAPRPRNSAGSGSSSTESTPVGSSSSSPEEKKKRKERAEDSAMEIDDLPPRPSTSLGFSPGADRMGTLRSMKTRGDKGKEKEKAGKKYDGLFPSAKRASTLSKGKALASSDDEDDEEEEEEETATTSTNSKGKGKEGSPNTSTESVVVVSDCLQGCVIFVDVRTEEGSDASPMFAQMLKQLSAKVSGLRMSGALLVRGDLRFGTTLR